MTTPPSNPPPYGEPPQGPYGQPPQSPYPPPPPLGPYQRHRRATRAPRPYPPPPQGPYPPPASDVIGGADLRRRGYYGATAEEDAVGIDHRRWWSGLFALLAVAAIVFVAIVGKGTVTATDVKVGDCLKEIPGNTRVLTVDTVGCDKSHAGEVFAVLLMPEGDYPGQSAIEEYQNKCEPELASYAPDAITDDSVQLYVLYPTAETWEQGDRAVTCVATLDPPRTGSLKG